MGPTWTPSSTPLTTRKRSRASCGARRVGDQTRVNEPIHAVCSPAQATKATAP